MNIIYSIVAAAREQLVEQDLMDGEYNIIKNDQELIIETKIDGAALTVTINQSHPLYQSMLNEFERVDSMDHTLKHFSSVDQYRKVLSLFAGGSIETTVNECDNMIHVVVDHGGYPKDVSFYVLIIDEQWIRIYDSSTFFTKCIVELYVGEHNPNRHIMVYGIKFLIGLDVD